MTDHESLPGATHLECTETGETIESEQLIGPSATAKPLFARYDLDAIRDRFTRDVVGARRADLGLYAEVLPVRDRRAQVALGEGWTPLLDSERMADRLGVRRLLIKDEGQNPTGSFKARGLCLAVSRALELGATELALPSAGSAVGDFLILRALRESGGGAVAVPDHQMAEWVAHMGADTGVFAAPEGGATAAAVPMFLERGLINSDDEVVLFNTGSGLKYVGMTPVD